MEYHRGTVQKDKAQTISTMGGRKCRSYDEWFKNKKTNSKRML
jgi:hypothetical protein